MIFTECAYCDEGIIVGWECGDPYGFYRSECEKCGKSSFVELTSFGGETLNKEQFWEKYPDAIPPKNRKDD